MAIRGPMDLLKKAPLLITAGSSIISTNVLPGVIQRQFPALPGGVFVKYGLQGVVAIGGGMLIGRFIGRQHGAVWSLAGAATLISNIIVEQVLPMVGVGLPQVGDYTVSDYEVGEYAPPQVDAFPDYGVTVGAFPTSEYSYQF